MSSPPKPLPNAPKAPAFNPEDSSNLDWRSRKPKFFKQPKAWILRKFRLKLGDLANLVGCRVIQHVGLAGLRSHISAKHIIDVGVGWGTSDLHQRFPDAILELFEPAPVFFPAIESKVLKGREGRLHKVALGREEGESIMHRAGTSSGSLVAQASTDDQTIKVPVKRLDSILSPDDIMRPSLLKIDTEGFELAVLEGSTGILKCIDTVVVELQLRRKDLYAPNDMITFLAAQGFEVTDIVNFDVIEGLVQCADVVFERKH